MAYTRLGRFEVAQTYFERALQVDATSASTLNNYGWSLIEQGRVRDAEPFLELALQRAAEADLPVVAANLESIRRARTSPLIAALERDGQPEAASGHRLIRLSANVYRLETIAGRAEDVGVNGSTRASAEQVPSAAPALDMPLGAQFRAAPMEIMPEPASRSAAILPGQRT
jgi:tetratricopeptide (TPR) repeat protein